jgi:hypothetical protein
MPSATSFVRAEHQSEVGGQKDSTLILQQHQDESRRLERRNLRKRFAKNAEESSVLCCDDDTLGGIVEHENDSQASWIRVDTLYRIAPGALFPLLLIIISPLFFFTATFSHRPVALSSPFVVSPIVGSSPFVDPDISGIESSGSPILTIFLLISALSIFYDRVL